MSIQRKLNLALGTILLLLLIIAVSVSTRSERQLGDELVQSLLHDKASSYLDSMNMLMISGAIGNRELLREKLLADQAITDARMIRSDIVNRIYGNGYPHEQAADDLDRRALRGETILQEQQTANGRVITLIQPIVAEENYRGTNCLGCHQAKAGDILGATRISYSMSTVDAGINSNATRLGLIQAVLMAVALLTLSLLLRRFIVSPIRRMQSALAHIEQHSDLSHKLRFDSHDEVGQAGNTLNRMTQRISDSLRQVVSAAEQLQLNTRTIDESARRALDTASQQRQETLQMQAAIDSLLDSSRQVVTNASDSTEAASNARNIASLGMQQTEQAAGHIITMNDAIRQTSDVIGLLDERTNSVGGVLAVIRGIAEQTNLLALNAAIEAARAGESGRGFAVVADEVRTLSQRTHDSTREIETMIAQLQNEARNAVGAMEHARVSAEQGVSQVQQATSALRDMIGQMNNMTRLNDATLHSMEQQAQLGAQVASGISSVRQLSEDTTHNAARTSQSVHELAELAERLHQLVQQFRL